MRIGLLGSLRITTRDEEPLEISGSRLRSLTARLALDAGRTVGVDTLIDDIWGEQAPDGAPNALSRLVSRLRRALPEGSTLLRSDRGGYRLLVAETDVDALCFERLVTSGRSELAAGRPDAAARILGDAQRLWRGAVLGGLGDPPFAALVAIRLTELRVQAAEHRITAELALGRHSDVSAEVERLAAEHPLRERLQGQLMRVRYATGRQADALTAFERVRTALRVELGADPSAELTALHGAILRQEPDLIPVAGTASPRKQRVRNAVSPTDLVGRDGDLRALRAMLDTHRLVTITGPGGVGKTRIALALTDDRVDTHLIELAPLDSPDDLYRQILLASEGHGPGSPVEIPSAAPGLGTLTEVLRQRRVLLVLDNCEHLIDAAAELTAHLLATCPELRFIAISREPLGIAGEARYPLPPLGLPPADVPLSAAPQYPAVRLLTERAAAVRPGFAVTDTNVEAVTDICRRLDGLPLALELAAAQFRLLTPEQIAARLDDRFQMLTAAFRDTPARHSTLRAVVESSWETLTEPECRLARRFSIFRGTVTLPAVEEICADHGGEHRLPPTAILDALRGLVDKSVIAVVPPDPPATEMGYRMLDTLRIYGARRLHESGEATSVRAAHARYWLAVAEGEEPRLRTGDQLRALRTLRAAHPDLLAALRNSLADENAAVATRLCAALMWYWILQGAGYDFAPVEAVLDLDDEHRPAERAIVAAAHTLVVVGFGRAEPGAAQRSVAVARAHPGATGHPLLALLPVIVAQADADIDRARGELTHLFDTADRWTRAVARLFHGFIDELASDLPAAGRHFRHARNDFQAVGDRWGLWSATQGVAKAHAAAGEPAAAATCYREALGYLTELGATRDIPALTAQIGHQLLHSGDHCGAHAELTHALDLARGHGPSEALVWAAFGLGLLAAEAGDIVQARRWYDQALAAGWRERSGDCESAAQARAAVSALVHATLADLAVRHEEDSAARNHLRSAVDLAIRSMHPATIATVAARLAEVIRARGAAAVAAELTDFADAYRRGRTMPHDAAFTILRRAAEG
ncbi:BTAD domain-containing putative transcriptional regulator [Nocardia sp. NPDC127579]|uniref:BTAD domain-containing putative transcriptional regulator n=1 Tax=Nocardia sp. NPDC127579 TaxID=3345402 RepID=UPI003639BB4F